MNHVHHRGHTHAHTAETGVELQWNKYIDVDLKDGITQTLPSFFIKWAAIEDTHKHTEDWSETII